ncbi:MAG: hypothetical protein COA99_19200 [Moraxellaceae bacterium]|nr:MAG: hypothetical protein COA99_19200 [Moraxellaceae bacterium]
MLLACNGKLGFVLGCSKLLVLCCLLIGTSYAHLPNDLSIGAPDPFNNWKTLETEHFRINFQQKHFGYAQKMAAIAERVHLKTTDWLQWKPVDKTEIVINDSFDGSNGGASTLPYNRFFIFMNTPVDGGLQDRGDWLELVFTHEYIHILHLDQVTNFPSNLRDIFGRLFFTFPQFFNPKWITEGLAVYGETEKDNAFGRGQGAIYHAMMREEVRNGLRSLSELSYQGYRGTDWPSGQVYLYGYYFFEFLEVNYSKDDVIRYIQNWNDNIIPWRMDSRSRQVFGVSSDRLWKNYQSYLENKFRAEIDAQEPQRAELAWVTKDKREHSNPRISSEGDLYFYQNNGRTEPSIERIDNSNQQHHVATVHGFSQFDWHDEQGILLSRVELCDNTNVFADLYRWNAANEDWLRLTECGRYPRAAWRSDGKYIVAVHVENGLSGLDFLNADGELYQRLLALPDGYSMGDVDWFVPALDDEADNTDDLARGIVVAAVKRKKTGWNLELLDVANNSWRLLTLNNDLESKPKFSADGKWVYFVSDHGRQFNVRKVNVATGEVVTVSNSVSFVKDYAVANDQLALMEYQATGFGIRKVTETTDDSASYSAKSADKPNVRTFENSSSYKPEDFTDVTSYDPWPSTRPRAWWPLLSSDGYDNVSVQVVVSGSDALRFHQWQFSPTYYFNSQELGGDASYTFYNRLTFFASRTIEIQRESIPEKNQPEVKDVEDRLQAVLQLPINSMDESFRVHAGIATETINRYTEHAPKLDAKDSLFGLSMQYSNVERYLHSISLEDGRRIKLSYEIYDTLGDGFYTGPVVTADWREYISFSGNHVLALHWVQGKAAEAAKPFELGGNLELYGSLAGNIGFGLSDFPLRGYGKDHPELIGQQISLITAEWRAPLIEVFDGWMKPPLGLGKTSLAVFVDTGKAWDVGESGKYYTGVGIEFRPELMLGLDTFLLDTRLGFAQGLDKDIGEASFYFSLGASF